MALSEHTISGLRRILKNSVTSELSNEAMQKLKWFLFAAEHDGNVSLTCRHFGISRSTFLRWSERFDAADLRTLDEQSRCPHNVRAPETDAATIALVTSIRKQEPLASKEKIRETLLKTNGIALSTSTIGRIINRHKLFFADTASHRAKRGETGDDTSFTDTTAPVRTPSFEGNDERADVPFLPEPGLTS